MRRCKQIGLALITLTVLAGLPSPDDQVVSHPPLVITADAVVFKVKPKIDAQPSQVQPAVFCGVTVC